jgi:tetratricopeptide (TPR) repeat protein
MKKSPPRSWSSQSSASRCQAITRIEWPTATAGFLLADAAGQPPELGRQIGLERAAGSFVANNLCFNLLDAGRWSECEQLTRELLAGDRWGAFNLHNALGTLLTRRGEFAAAHEQLNLALRLSPPFFEDSAWLGLAELALWEGRHDEARAAMAEGLRWYTVRDPQRTLLFLSSPWYSLALRLEADRAERAAARRVIQEVAEARRRSTPVLVELDRLAAGPTPQAAYPFVVAHLQLARAEQSRLGGRSDPERWRVAVEAWERLEHPFPAAYASFREAEALLAGRASRQHAETVLRAAHQTAVALGAGPLRREIELLAQRGRLRLQESADTAATPEASSPAASLGLTKREAEVLALVAEGRTNRQIGQALFITPRPPASTSQGSLPSSGSPVAGKRRRSPTASASTNNDPLTCSLFLLAGPSDITSGRAVPSIPRSSATRCSTWPRCG